MTKRILILFLGLLLAGAVLSAPGYAQDYAQDYDQEWGVEMIDDYQGWIYGLGALYATSPYEGADNDVWPVPIIFGRHEQFYADGTSAGFIFSELEDPNLDFSAVLQPRFMGYDSDDSDTLAGMEDRDWSLDGGLRARWSNKHFRLIATGLADLSGNHEGFERSSDIWQSMTRSR